MGAFEAVSAKTVVAAVVLVGVVAVGGATLFAGGDTGAAIDQVPSGVDTVVRLDMTITNDRATQLLALAGGASVPGGGSDNASGFRATFENQTGIDAQQADEIVVFSAVNDSVSSNTTYVGAILHTDASTDAAVAGVQNTTSTAYAEQTVSGQRVYAPTNGTGYWVGVLGDGQIVVGTQAAVTDTVGVTAGAAESFGGPLRTAYDGTRNGTVRFATTSPDVLLPPDAAFVTNVQLYRDLQAVGGAYYLDGSRTGVEVQLRTNNANNAQSVAQATNGTAAILRNSLENETAIEAVNAVEIDQQGSTVTVSYEAQFGEFQRVFRYAYGVQGS